MDIIKSKPLLKVFYSSSIQLINQRYIKLITDLQKQRRKVCCVALVGKADANSMTQSIALRQRSAFWLTWLWLGRGKEPGCQRPRKKLWGMGRSPKNKQKVEKFLSKNLEVIPFLL
jgi:hypothetical protein